MNNLKIGDKVIMNDKYWVNAENKGKVWTVDSEPWECCGTNVVKLKGKAGGYSVDGLDLAPKYIDANSFLEYEENRCKNFPPIIGTCSFDNATLRGELANFLAADVKPVRHGHWEEAIRARRSIAGKIEDFRCYECSACSKSSFYKTDYCPNCGAKMAEEGHNENSNTNTTRLL